MRVNDIIYRHCVNCWQRNEQREMNGYQKINNKKEIGESHNCLVRRYLAHIVFLPH